MGFAVRPGPRSDKSAVFGLSSRPEITGASPGTRSRSAHHLRAVRHLPRTSSPALLALPGTVLLQEPFSPLAAL